MTKQEARAQYGELRRWATYDNATKDEFDAAVLKVVSAVSSAEGWVVAAKTVRLPCKRCAGTGRFITYVENGQPKGPGGACFRCGGLGSQTPADGKRNHYHDLHYVPPGVYA